MSIYEFGKGLNEAKREFLAKSYTNLDPIEKGGVGSGRKKITINSPMVSHFKLNGKTYEVHKESEHYFASGLKKYYHIKDENGDEHEIKEDFVKKSEDTELQKAHQVLGIDIEKGGVGSGRKKITIDSKMASHSKLHGKTYEVHNESDTHFASGSKKYYHIKDEEGNEHKISEDFVKKSEIGEIEKANGEGSRGGKVIGHTKSGKPIYASKQASDYSNFTAQDHKEAASVHRQMDEKVDHHQHHAIANEHDKITIKNKKESSFIDVLNDKEETKDIKDNIELYDDNYHVYRRRYLQTQSDEDRYKMNKWLNLRKEQEKLLKDKEGVDVKKSEDNDLQKAYEILGLEDLIKGGEGTRGGIVIGHTKSGKPIYNKNDHKAHSNFTQEEHSEAAEIFGKYKGDRYIAGKKQEGEKNSEVKKEQYASYTDEQLNEEHKQYLAGNEYGDEKLNRREHRDFRTLSRERKIEYLVEPTQFIPTEDELRKMK